VDWHKATELAKDGILLPPKLMVSKGFSISLDGVPVTPLPEAKDFGYEVFQIW
jgi:hypothetical protein